jgi:DNA (cytosine-5)-methyltransferase 1
MLECRIGGDVYVLTGVGLRMLTPRELARCQGFWDDYVLTGTRESQVERIGNSVSPYEAHDIVAAQFAGELGAA